MAAGILDKTENGKVAFLFDALHVDFTLLNPRVIFEILSRSTELYDKGKKFTHYRLIPSLQEYILVSQYHCHVEQFIRGDDGIWRLFDPCTAMEDRIKLLSIDCELLLSDIYSRVEFESRPSRSIRHKKTEHGD